MEIIIDAYEVVINNIKRKFKKKGFGEIKQIIQKALCTLYSFSSNGDSLQNYNSNSEDIDINTSGMPLTNSKCVYWQ